MTWPADSAPDSLLQQGIYLERGVPPPPAWRALFLDVRPGADSGTVKAGLTAIDSMLTDLQAGVMRELAPERIPSDTFAFLLCYGSSLFDPGRHTPNLTTRKRPEHLVRLRRNGSAFPSLPWTGGADAEDVTPTGEADILLQFTGLSEHAVNRAAVEVSHLIDDKGWPFDIAGTFDGFLRDDGRSWIGFHDGVNNIEPSERRAAVECTGDPAWNRGGTYLAFFRLRIDIRTWRTLSQEQQELIVGREKRTGWPIGSTVIEREHVRPQPIGNAPVMRTTEWRERGAYFNPPDSTDRILEASHVHRTNQNKASAATRSAHRIFRQGYEYLENLGPDGPELGLNFISFQNHLRHIHQILSLHGWLGDANFGGVTAPGIAGPPSIALTTLRAGGFYVVPPRETPFPGASLFDAQ